MKNLKLLVFIYLTFQASSCKDEDPVPSNNPESAFEQVWNDFDQLYPYFEIKGLDWDSVYNENRPNIDQQTTFSELASIIAEITLSLKDIHVRFSALGKTHRFQKRANFGLNLPDNARNYLTNIAFDNERILFGVIENTDIAYVRIKKFGGSISDFSEFSIIFSSLPSKSGLIVDVRENGGGSDAIGKAFANQLTDSVRIFEYFRFRNGPEINDFGEWIPATITPDQPVEFDKPIIVLTNRGCYSSTESFVLMMRSIPNVILVGDTTGGSTANPREFTLFNGWKYYVSTWQAVTPEFVLIEDHGIAPDIVQQNDQQLYDEGRDQILEKAVELLQ